ncbi:hypothetical protein [Desulfovirgula thermocuniculi]|uniref:hypothetical protein n=1 Tax=Desulfovirgula thermocuniculi TaxID=348842 RepID=UPI0004193C31|nr:hypothetical protein [Desulfovirgula thermocuniculi]
MPNSIWLYRIFDVADEINLNKVEELLAHTKPTSRLRLSRLPLRAVHIPNPPVTVELGEDVVAVGGRPLQVRFAGKIYDLGVISLVMHVLIPPHFGYEEIRDLAVFLDENQQAAREINAIFEGKLKEITGILSAAMVRPGTRNAEEDYTLFFFQEWREEWDPVPLLLADPDPVSPQVRKETLQHTFSYGPGDMAIITWASALVYDAAGSQDIPDLLEFALTQLVELRYYDKLLSEEMGKMYDDIEEAERATQLRRLGYYRHIMNRLMELVVDINEILERIQNSIKVTEDVYYARVYGAALSVFRTRAWVESIERKLSVIMQNYTMLSNRVINQQSTLLEAAIVLLFALEILLTLANIAH